jgi:hypothetical protein
MVLSEKKAPIRTGKQAETINNFIGDHKFWRWNWESPVFPAKSTSDLYPFQLLVD